MTTSPAPGSGSGNSPSTSPFSSVTWTALTGAELYGRLWPGDFPVLDRGLEDLLQLLLVSLGKLGEPGRRLGEPLGHLGAKLVALLGEDEHLDPAVLLARLA